MDFYNINDLLIASYNFKNITWSHGKILQSFGVKKSVLCKISDGKYRDVISDYIIFEKDILCQKHFIAKDELLNKTQIAYIFNVLENLMEEKEDLVNTSVISPIKIIEEAVKNAQSKVKKISLNIKKPKTY